MRAGVVFGLVQSAAWSEWAFSTWTAIETAVRESIVSLITSVFARLPFLVASLIVLALFYVGARLLRWIFVATTRRSSLDGRLRLLFSRLIVMAIVILGVLTALTVVVPSFAFGDLIAGLGFTSFVIGFATKDILNNFLSGILILWQRPFQIGDHLFIGNHQGKVEYIGVRATSLRKDDGELILIPNGDMYSTALTIRGAGASRRMNLKFNLGFDIDLEKAKDVVCNALLSTEGVVGEPRPTVRVAELTGEGAVVNCNFWINTNESRPLQVFDQAAIAVVNELGREGIELFPPASMIVQRAPEQESGDKRRSAGM
jgi:small-conductance mechanosensitive channel